MVCFTGRTGCDLVIYAALILAQEGRGVLVCDQSEEQQISRMIPKPSEPIPAVHFKGADFYAGRVQDMLIWLERTREHYEYCFVFEGAGEASFAGPMHFGVGAYAAVVAVTDWHRDNAAAAEEAVTRSAGTVLVIRDVRNKAEAEMVLQFFEQLRWSADTVLTLFLKEKDREQRIAMEYGKVPSPSKLSAEYRAFLFRLLNKITGLTAAELSMPGCR